MDIKDTVLLQDALRVLPPIQSDGMTTILAINPITGQVGTIAIPKTTNTNTGGGAVTTLSPEILQQVLQAVKQDFTDEGILTTS